MAEPRDSAEYVDGAEHVIGRFFAPILFERGDVASGDVAALLAVFEGHPMAKAALEMAVLDAELRAAGVSFADHLGAVADRVPAGVSVGITATTAELLEQVDRYLDEGYRGSSSRSSPASTSRSSAPSASIRRRDPAPGRRQLGLHARRRRAPCRSSTPSTSC